MSAKRILVTGGLGFIGSFLVDELLRRGHVVRVLDSLDHQVHPGGKPPAYFNWGVDFVRGDVRDVEALRRALRNVEVVFHKAAAVGMGQSQYQIKRYVDTNIGGTANLLDLLVNTRHRVEKVIVAASMSSYGEGAYRCDRCGPVRPAFRTEEQVASGMWDPPCPSCGGSLTSVPTDETAVSLGTAVYATTKRVQEELVLNVGRMYRIPVVALRYFNVYGPRQSLSNPYTGVAAIFMSRMKNGHRPVIYEDGLQTRDFVSVHDVVRANLLSMERSEADYEAFNVGSGLPLTIREVASTLSKLYGVNISPEITNRFRKGDVRHCYADTTKIRTRLGFTPQVSFEEGMKELIEWSRGVEAQDGFERAARELKEKGLV
jgi:dTDP-L-rhamnose 4-epimerase